MHNIVVESLRQAARVKTGAVSDAHVVVTIAERLAECLRADGRVYVVGNGGSAADAQHFAAEFTGRFSTSRRPLPVIALTTDTSALTCIGNDFGFDHVFSRQVEALARPGDLLIAMSSSGNSPNVVASARAARQGGALVVGMTGQDGGDLVELSDVVLRAPSRNTARIQECQMTVLHIICDLAEQLLGFGQAREAAQDDLRAPAGLQQLRAEWRRQGLRVVSTNGCFDVLHAGHLDSLSRASALGDVLVVLINSDASTARLKGPTRPVNASVFRATLLEALAPVDHVFVFEEDEPSAILSFLQPDVHCKGDEYAGGRLPVPEAAVVEEFGGRMHFLPRSIDLSTTSILDRLAVVGVDD